MLTQGVKRLLIGRQSFRLMPGRCIPLHAELVELFQDRLACTGDHAGRVEILHAHQPFAAMGSRIKIARHGGDQRAFVKRAAGAGRETPDIGLGQA